MPRSARRFFKTPKGLLTVILAILIVIAAPGQGGRMVAVRLASSAIAAGLVDMLIRRVRRSKWEYPSGAVLTAAIIVMVLRAQEPWYVDTVTSVIAILSKYIFRLRRANVFNPAALAMVIAYHLFHAGQSWWGAQADGPGVAKLVLLVAGVFISSRVNKMPLVLTFLATYFTLFTITAFIGDALSVAEIFRSPDFEAALYFAFLILTDPPTSPSKYRDQIICGPLVAVVSYACFELTGVVYFLLSGVLAGNVWEAWRRASRRRGKPFRSQTRGPSAEQGKPIRNTRIVFFCDWPGGPRDTAAELASRSFNFGVMPVLAMLEQTLGIPVLVSCYSTRHRMPEPGASQSISRPKGSSAPE